MTQSLLKGTPQVKRLNVKLGDYGSKKYLNVTKKVDSQAKASKQVTSFAENVAEVESLYYGMRRQIDDLEKNQQLRGKLNTRQRPRTTFDRKKRHPDVSIQIDKNFSFERDG